MKNKSDVSFAVAGYYRQIMEAVYESLKLRHTGEKVALEYGADVRVIRIEKGEEKKHSIELKFKKGKIGIYDKDLYQTIYNFYLQTKDDDSFNFISNTDISSTDEKIVRNKNRYIKHLLLKYEITKIQKNKNSTLTKKNEELIKIVTSNKNEKSIDKKIEKSFEEMVKCSEIIDLSQISIFAEKCTFNFLSEKKNINISNKKDSIKRLIKEQILGIENEDVENIINKLVIKFLDKSVSNSLLEDGEVETSFRMLEYQTVKEIITNYNEKIDVQDYLLLRKFNEMIDKFNVEGLEKDEIINLYNKDFMNYKNELFMGNKTELEALYENGFGIIGYLLQFNLFELLISKDTLIITNSKGKNIGIANKGLYDFMSIIQYLKSYETENRDGISTGEFFYGEFIKIAKYTIRYIFNNRMKKKEKEYDFMYKSDFRKIIDNSENTLIIKPAPLLAKNFLYNFLIEYPLGLKKVMIAMDATDFSQINNYKLNKIGEQNADERMAHIVKMIDYEIEVSGAQIIILNFQYTPLLNVIEMTQVLKCVEKYSEIIFIIIQNHSMKNFYKVNNISEIDNKYIISEYDEKNTIKNLILMKDDATIIHLK